MAYRFMLETPESVAGQVNLEIAAADGAETVVSRASLAHGYDRPYTSHTIAAQNLHVIDALFAWAETLPAGERNLHLVLHSGERIDMQELSRDEAVAAIRRDQPWVERTIPKIGDHVETQVDPEWRGDTASVAEPLGAVVNASPAVPAFLITDVNFVAIQVNDLEAAISFYRQFFSMDLIGRSLIGDADIYSPIVEVPFWDPTHSARTAEDDDADTAFLRNGPLTLALRRVGMGGRIDRSVLDRISITVDQSSLDHMRGWALMRSFETLGTRPGAFLFRDPYGVAWEVRLQAGLHRNGTAAEETDAR